MKGKDIGKIFGVTTINVVISLLNAAFQPFAGTIFVFDDWQSVASKTAIAVDFVVVLIVASLIIGSKYQITRGAIIWNASAAAVFALGCVAIHILLASGFAPTETFLFWIWDVAWMFLYIAMLVMVGVTVALTLLKLSGTT